MAVKEAPSYRRLYEKLRTLMEDGTYKRGDLLPSENELCAAHHLTRPTVRKALDMLVNDGFILRQVIIRHRRPRKGERFKMRVCDEQTLFIPLAVKWRLKQQDLN